MSTSKPQTYHNSNGTSGSAAPPQVRWDYIPRSAINKVRTYRQLFDPSKPERADRPEKTTVVAEEENKQAFDPL